MYVHTLEIETGDLAAGENSPDATEAKCCYIGISALCPVRSSDLDRGMSGREEP